MWNSPWSHGCFLRMFAEKRLDRSVFLPENQQQKTPMLYRRRFDPKKSSKSLWSHFFGRRGGGNFDKNGGDFWQILIFIHKKSLVVNFEVILGFWLIILLFKCNLVFCGYYVVILYFILSWVFTQCIFTDSKTGSHGHNLGSRCSKLTERSQRRLSDPKIE